jgi:hypothetical protein
MRRLRRVRVDRTFAARLALRRELAALVRRYPELTALESQERARLFLETEDARQRDTAAVPRTPNDS